MLSPARRVNQPMAPPSVRPPTPGMAHQTRRHREIILLSGRVQIAQQRATTDTRTFRLRIDDDLIQGTQVDHQRSVGDR
jgi:hypothetical protein